MASVHIAVDVAGVSIVADDTKVVSEGAGNRVCITTAGVDVVRDDYAGAAAEGSVYANIEAGDRILVSGPITDHDMVAMPARGDLTLAVPIKSDTCAISDLIGTLPGTAPGTYWMHDATRGGLGAVVNKSTRGTGLGAVLDDESVAAREATHGACDMLGINPLYTTNEGTFVATVPAEQSEVALSVLHTARASEARDTDSIEDEPAASVVLVTGPNGTRMVGMLVGDPPPRTC